MKITKLKPFDRVIFGAGWSGFGAVQNSIAQGKRTLIVDSGGDVLWESTRALENTLEGGDASETWRRWAAHFRERQAAAGSWVEPAFLEAWAAEDLRNCELLSVLFYAAPVEAVIDKGSVAAVRVATKNGLLNVPAGEWVDATEEGAFIRVCGGFSPCRQPSSHALSLVAYSAEPAALQARISEALPEVEVLESVRASERRIRWVTDPTTPLWSALRDKARSLRDAAEGIPLLISHASTRPFPVYAHDTAPALPGLPHNLIAAGGVFSAASVNTPAARWLAGQAADFGNTAPSHRSFPPPLGTREIEREVVVAGGGTGGAIAALAAARQGARTAVFELAPLPGGVGTLGGISNYFHGAPGGLQTEVDERVGALSEVFLGVRPGPKQWHPLAKALALQELFAEAGIEFHGDTLIHQAERGPEGRLAALRAVSGGRQIIVRATAFIDSTGDGDLCAAAGVPFSIGRPGDQRTLAFTQSSQTLDQTEWRIAPSNRDAGWVDATDPWDLSAARLLGLAQFLRDHWNAPNRPVLIAPQIGLRQSRQIKTDYAVSFADLLEGRTFPDSIGEVHTVADTHSVDYEFESDELAFYYWTCRAFRHPLQSELPYRMLLPRSLENVWIACRAAGVENDASYGLRMQREMQRLGEAAGVAAALAVQSGQSSRSLDFVRLQSRLRESGAIPPPAKLRENKALADWLDALDEGRPGIHLWWLSQKGDAGILKTRLVSPDLRISFYAAAVLAMQGDAAAEPRLLESLEAQEIGPADSEYRVPGPNGEIIDIPFWLQSVVLLRRIGTNRALPPLGRLAADPALPFNVRTCLGATLKRLAQRLKNGLSDREREIVADAAAALCESAPASSAQLPPARSLWKTLASEAQRPLDEIAAAKSEQDHTWQLHLLAAGILTALGRPVPEPWLVWRHDDRAFVRRAFTAANFAKIS